MADRESLFEVSLFGVADGQAVNNVFYLLGDTTGPAPPFPYPLEDVANRVATDWLDKVMPHLSNTYSVLRQVVKTVIGVQARTSRGRPITRRIYGEVDQTAFNATITGGRAGEALPTFAAYTCRKRTARAGKSFRGSFRAGPVAESDSVGNTIDTPRRTALNTDLTTFGTLRTTPFSSLPIRYVVFGARAAVIGGTLAQPFRSFAAALVACVANATFGSQVSRKRKELKLG